MEIENIPVSTSKRLLTLSQITIEGTSKYFLSENELLFFLKISPKKFEAIKEKASFHSNDNPFYSLQEVCYFYLKISKVIQDFEEFINAWSNISGVKKDSKVEAIKKQILKLSVKSQKDIKEFLNGIL